MEQSHPGCDGGAEAVINLRPNSTISIAYHPLFGPHDDMILLELDEKLLPDVLDQRISLRGQLEEDAVLCTQSKTYAVKFVGNSNSVLLIPPSDQFSHQSHIKRTDEEAVASVIKVALGNMELVEIAPKVDKLKLLLSRNPLKLGELTEKDDLDEMIDVDKNLYTWDDLTDMIQASDEELRTALNAFLAVEINGYWRIVDESYMDAILNILLQNSIMNDWSLNALNEDEVVGVLESDGFTRIIAHHCLQVYGSKVDRESLWRLDERKVCVHFARGILRGGKMKMEIFMEEWRRKVPERMSVNFDILEGEVLTETLGIQTWVYAFSISSLPCDPAARFSALFHERKKWEWRDLNPYIRDLSVPGLSSDALLLKYTRRTQPTPDSEPVFTMR
ncbi:uncharacterized protein LOC141724265 [Apium graveolens]|uniref:uncharacterized protein LOC141724265 n=1 Tax=Apium graveolens TaxID=4045 RepID=UPI003D7B14B4